MLLIILYVLAFGLTENEFDDEDIENYEEYVGFPNHDHHDDHERGSDHENGSYHDSYNRDLWIKAHFLSITPI